MIAMRRLTAGELGAPLVGEERLDAADVRGEAGVAVAESLEGFEGRNHLRGSGAAGQRQRAAEARG